MILEKFSTPYILTLLEDFIQFHSTSKYGDFNKIFTIYITYRLGFSLSNMN